MKQLNILTILFAMFLGLGLTTARAAILVPTGKLIQAFAESKGEPTKEICGPMCNQSGGRHCANSRLYFSFCSRCLSVKSKFTDEFEGSKCFSKAQEKLKFAYNMTNLDESGFEDKKGYLTTLPAFVLHGIRQAPTMGFRQKRKKAALYKFCNGIILEGIEFFPNHHSGFVQACKKLEKK